MFDAHCVGMVILTKDLLVVFFGTSAFFLVSLGPKPQIFGLSLLVKLLAYSDLLVSMQMVIMAYL